MPETADSSQSVPAVIAGRYVVLGLLGRGGMADVFRVRDERSGHELALKRLRAFGGERKLLASALFEREYYTLSQLAHPSVIRVYEYGVEDAGAHYTMELLKGADLLATGRRPWLDACRVLRDVASALAILHSRCWLHRDLSPRNVFDTEDGIAKLIDFGCMAPMGVAKSLVGTPPLVPPESVQQQTLDAQADLYSLGALAYFMLTGRHAFPARSFDELRDLWRTVVRPPERIVPEIPPALSQLVLDLLQLDRFARPASAGAVIERIDRLLGRTSDPAAERPEVSRAYFATPKLIGRDSELARVRERMVHALRGRGSVVLVEGEAGGGRSRFLDACVLEARLLGAAVLRADASDAARGDYGVVTTLGEQLVQFVPELAADVGRMRRAELSRVIPSLAQDDPAQEAAPAGERRHLQTALRDWFRAIARSKRIVIAVDDLERVDEPSLAVLAALAHKSERRKLVLVATVRTAAAASSGLELLREAALRISLGPLSATHTEAVLESLFGREGNTALLAHRVHELAAGNPRHVIALAEHVVQSGRAHYAAGRWTLPRQLDTDSLPASIEAALSRRIAGLDEHALSLAETLALTEPRAIALSEYSGLCGESDHARIFKRLDALVESGVLAPEGERYRFTHGGWKTLLTAKLDAMRTRQLHARIASALERSTDTLRTAHHLMESGDAPAAIARLVARGNDPSFAHSPASLALLERAVLEADALDMPLHNRLELRVTMIDASVAIGNLGVFTRVAPDVLETLAVASGLHAYAALDPALDQTRRLHNALGQAQLHYTSLPEHDRPFHPLIAIQHLSRLCFSFSSMAGIALDPSLVERLPSLTPFVSQWPAIELVAMTTEACKLHLAGRFVDARNVYMRLLARIESTDHAGLQGGLLQRSRLNACYGLGIVEASSGRHTALERVSVLEQHVGYRVNAWRVRMIHHATLGDLEEARRCERRAQLLLLQDGVRPFPATDLQAESAARIMSDDLEGLRHMLDRLRDAAEQFPERSAMHLLVQCHVQRLQGDAAAALERLAPLLARSTPEHSVRFAWIGGTHLMLLCALGRYAEAAAAGRPYLAASRARGLALGDCTPFVRPLVVALAHSGAGDEAVALSESLIAEYEAWGATGLLLGSCCEARARVALALHDANAFEHWVERCRSEYERARNPALSAKLMRLLRDGQAAHVGSIAPYSEPVRSAQESVDVAAQGTVLSRMAECVGARERARCALTLLLEETGLNEGHLYGWLSGRLTHFASVPGHAPPQHLERALQHHVESELRAADTTAAGGRSTDPADKNNPALGALRPALLSAERDGEPFVAACVALGPYSDASRKPSPQLLATLAQTLLEHDDFDAMTRLA